MQGVRTFVKAPTPIGFKAAAAKDHPECAVCKTYLYLHAVECSSTACGRYCCAHHAHALSARDPAKWTVHYRFSIRELLDAATRTNAAADRSLGDPTAVQLATWRPPVLIGKDDTPPVAIPVEFLSDARRRARAADARARDEAAELLLVCTGLGARPVSGLGGADASDDNEEVVRSILTEVVDSAVRSGCSGGPGDDSDTSHQTIAAAAGASEQDHLERGEGGPVYETRHVADAALVRQAVAREERAWHERAAAAIAAGGIKPAALDALLASGQALAWGESDPSALDSSIEHLRTAKAWLADVQALQRGRSTLEAAAALVERPVLPVATPAVAKLKEAVAVTRAWAGRVSAARAAEGALDITDARKLLEEGLALPLHSTDVARLQDAVAIAGGVQAQLEQHPSLLAREVGGAAEAPSLAPDTRMHEPDARQLHMQLAATHITFAEARALAAELEQMDKWNARARKVSDAGAALSDLHALASDAAGLALQSPDVEALTARISAAEVWIRAAESAMGHRPPLKEMRKLLHTGERMDVEMPQAAALKACIRRREWEDAAGKALSGKSTVTAAAQLAAEATAMGVAADAPALMKLQAAVDAVHTWEGTADELLARCEAVATATAGEGEAPSEDDIVACLSDAAPLRLRSERYTCLTALQGRAARWRAAARMQLDRGGGSGRGSGGGPPPPPPFAF
jgi:hypothetical protein